MAVLTLRRALLAALAASAAGAGCTALLDFDALQAGDPAAPGDDAGAGDASLDGDVAADAGADADAADAIELGKPCALDADCDEGDACTVDVCDPATQTCKPRTGWHGLGLFAESEGAQVVLQADDVGLPVVLATDTAFYLSAWYKKANHQTDARVRVYAADSAANPTDAELSAFALGLGVRATPGLAMGATDLTMLVAVDVEPTVGGMRFVSVDPTTLALHQSVSLGGTAHDGDPRRMAPTLFTSGGVRVGMWVAGGTLWTERNEVPTNVEATTATHVVGFAPIAGAADAPFGALVERDATGSTETKLWSRGAASFGALSGDAPGGRFGVASAIVDATGSAQRGPASLLAWSFSAGAYPQLRFAAAGCAAGATACSSVSFDVAGMPAVGYAPALAAVTPALHPIDRDVSLAYALALADAQKAGNTASILFGAVTRQRLAPADGGLATTVEVNPPGVPLASVSVPASTSIAGALGQAATGITPRGKVLFAWVTRDATTTKATLRAQRFYLRDCP